jgi:hypothetical protein
VQAQCSGRNQTGVEVWMAQGTPNGDGTVTATLASSPANAVIAVSRYSGAAAVNPVGNVISGNTNGIGGSCSDGSDNSSYSFNLATTVDGAVVYGAVAMRNNTHTPGAGFTEQVEIQQGSGGDVASVAVEDKSVATASTVAVDGSFSSEVDWAVIAVGIKPRAALAKDRASSEEEKLLEASLLPVGYQLHQNSPNPFSVSAFNAATKIVYQLPQRSHVNLALYDLLGRRLKILVNKEQAAGTYEVGWDGRDASGNPLPSGVYIYRIEAGSFRGWRRLLLVK